MSLLFMIARVLFSVLFVVSGTLKLKDVSGTAAYIASKVAIPPLFADLAAQAESATGMQAPQLMAIGVGLVELVFGLLLAFGIAVRFASLVLAIFTLLATFYFHDFWNQVDPERSMNMVQAEKNLSIFAGLLVFFVLGAWRPAAAEAADEYYTRAAPSDETRRDSLPHA